MNLAGNSNLFRPDDTVQALRLKRLIGWMILICAGSVLVYGVIAVAFAQIVIALLGAVVGMEALVLVGLRWMIGRKPFGWIGSAMSLSIVIVILCFHILLPVLFPAMVTGLVLTIAFALPYVTSRTLLRLSIFVWLLALVLTISTRYPALFEPLPEQATGVMLLFVTPSVVALCLWLLWQFHRRLTDSLNQAQGANAALLKAQVGLETQVAERTSALTTALAEVEARARAQEQLLAENERQREVIRELSVPVLRVGADTLVMPLVGALDSTRLQVVQQQALASIERQGARRLLLDITGVPVVDSQVAQGLLMVVQSGRLLGAEVVLVGIRPEVAQAIVGLGLQLGGMTTFSDVQMALMR